MTTCDTALWSGVFWPFLLMRGEAGAAEEMARAEDIAVFLLEGLAALYTGTTNLLAERQHCHGGFWKEWLIGVAMGRWRTISICGKVGAEG